MTQKDERLKIIMAIMSQSSGLEAMGEGNGEGKQGARRATAGERDGGSGKPREKNLPTGWAWL